MKLQDVLDIINFAIATQQDLSGKAVGSLFKNKEIIMQLKAALDKYASYTRGIEAIYSFPLNSSNLAIINEPPLALRSKAYRFILVFVGGVAWPILLNDQNVTYGNFPVQAQGLSTSGLAWEKMIYLFPQSGASNSSTTLSNNISASDTTITVANAKNFPMKNGRISIGNETIFYGSRNETVFSNCIRGFENTTATNHSSGDTVNENNVWIYYYKRHFEILVDSNDEISSAYLDKEMEVYDEHMQVITDYTAYKLLQKVDSQRAASYKVDFTEWLEEAKLDIESGRSDIMQASEIRSKFYFENPTPFNVF